MAEMNPRGLEILQGDYVRFVVDAPNQSGGIAGRGWVKQELCDKAEIQLVTGEVEIRYLPSRKHLPTFVPLEALTTIVVEKSCLEPLFGEDYQETCRLHNSQLMMGIG
jgi:hypothetical protein